MMTFKELAEQMKHKDGTYVSVDLSSKSADQLFKWVHEQDISNPVPKKDYHCTVVYSTNPIPEAKEVKVEVPFTASFDKWEIFPTQTGDKCLVARIKCSGIEKLHQHYHKNYPAKYDYDEYKPHVTVSYKFTGSLPDEEPDFPLVFDSYTFKGLNKDWKPE